LALRLHLDLGVKLYQPYKLAPAVFVFVLVIAGCSRPPAFECEIRVLLPATSKDPDNGISFGKLTINGEEMPEVSARTRLFKVRQKSAEETLTVVYDFWPRNYTNVIRTRVAPVKNGTVIDIDLTAEVPQFPDGIRVLNIPTPLPVVERMCKLAAIGPNDVVYDIGCGDGRMVMTAVSKFAAKKGVGIDIDSELIEDCKKNAARAGLQDRIDFRVGDALKLQSLDDATVVMLYVGEHLNRKLRPILKNYLKSRSRIVSHDFDMGDWKPDRTERFMELNIHGVQEEFCLHLWIIK
jgi:SAM-dependent methyltransferase